jgi:hypothetical protein
LQTTIRRPQSDIRISPLIRRRNLVRSNEVAPHPALARALNEVVVQTQPSQLFEGVDELRRAVAEAWLFRREYRPRPATAQRSCSRPGRTCHAGARICGRLGRGFLNRTTPITRKRSKPATRGSTQPLLDDSLDLDELRRFAAKESASEYRLRQSSFAHGQSYRKSVFARRTGNAIVTCAENDLLPVSDEVYEHFTKAPDHDDSHLARRVRANDLVVRFRVLGVRLRRIRLWSGI